MAVTEDQVREALRRVKGPDLESNIVDLGLVSEILIKDGRVYFSITVSPTRAEELEPLRQAAAKVVSDLDGVEGATAVLTAERAGGQGASAGGSPPRAEHPRVTAARAQGAARNRILDRRDDHPQADRQAKRHDHPGKANNRSRPAHILLHQVHACGRLDVEAPGVEAHALADQRQARPGLAPVQVKQTRGTV